MASVKFTGHSTASPETVWEILSDHVGMPNWTPIRSVTLETEGDPAPNGVGAIRVIRAVGPVLREQVTAFEPGRRLVYRMLSGAPVRDYEAQVDLSGAGGGTDIVWQASFKPRLPGVRAIVSAIVARLVKGLVAEADRRSAAAA
jgi:uncharacterized protein YndB with AHSA1/START domain